MMKVIREFDKFSNNNYVMYIDNGVFLDGRDKALKEHGLQRKPVTPTSSAELSSKTPKKSKKEREREGNKGVTGCCSKDYHCDKWMER